MWSLSVTNEVYTVHLFFVTALFLLVLSSRMLSFGDLARMTVLGSYLIGLSLSHHLSTLLLAPAILFWVLATRSVRVHAARLLAIAVPVFLLALTVYLYLPIRASLSPAANWGDPSTLENLVRHISGWQYQVWMFNKPLSGIVASMAELLSELTVRQFSAVLLVPALFGAAILTIRDRVVSAFILIVFVTNLVYLAGYTIPEIDTYMLPLVMIYSLWIVIGVASGCGILLNRLSNARIAGSAPYLSAGILLVIGTYMVIENRSFADRSDYRYVETQTRMLLDSMEPGAVFLTANWDFYSPLLYKKFVEGERTDVTAIDVELLRRSWYYEFIAKTDAGLYQSIRKHVDDFMPHVRRFERDERFDAVAIENAYQSIITAIAAAPGRPAYIDLGTKFRDSKKFSRIPAGPAFRLVGPEESYAPKPFRRMSLGGVNPDLLESDYSLRKQIEIIDAMNGEWKSFWDWYQQQNRVTPGE
jgi:hypothetical protein